MKGPTWRLSCQRSPRPPSWSSTPRWGTAWSCRPACPCRPPCCPAGSRRAPPSPVSPRSWEGTRKRTSVYMPFWWLSMTCQVLMCDFKSLLQVICWLFDSLKGRFSCFLIKRNITYIRFLLFCMVERGNLTTYVWEQCFQHQTKYFLVSFYKEQEMLQGNILTEVLTLK